MGKQNRKIPEAVIVMPSYNERTIQQQLEGSVYFIFVFKEPQEVKSNIVFLFFLNEARSPVGVAL